MVRLLLFITAILIFQLDGKSQVTVSVDPTSFIMSGNPLEVDVVFHVHVTNTSSQTANLFWSKRMSNNPANWYSWICDKNLCYDPSYNACHPNKPNIVEPNESFDLQVHMNPVSTEGNADYELCVLDDQGNVLVCIDGDVLISNSTAVKEATDSKLSVFPNPTTDFFQVSETAGLKSIELFNIVGNKVRSYDALPQKQYYVGDLTDGIYLVRLVSSTQKVLKTIRLSKR